MGRPSRAFPVTPPCVRLRARRFGELCGNTAKGEPAGLSVVLLASAASALHSARLRASPSSTTSKARSPCIFCRSAPDRAASYSPLPPFGPSSHWSETTMPSADFCAAVRESRDSLSCVSATRRRPPEVSLASFHARPPNLQPRRLMDTDFVVLCPLVPS